MVYKGGQRGSRQPAAGSSARAQRITEQQQVLERLRSGQGISAQPATPFAWGVRALQNKPAAMGTVYGAELGGESVLRMPGGGAQLGSLNPINVGGRTWFPAKSGKDVIFMQGTQSPGLGRAANAAEQDDGRIGGLFKGIAASDIGGDGSSDEARALASQYAPKPFPMTPEGQFERYFKTPEMDQYFGAASRGEGAPKDVAGMESLAGQLTAPQDVPLSAYYRAQSAAGRANMPKITQELEYAEGSPLAKWAAANPMLAQRLYAKKQAGKPTGLAPDEQTVMGDLGSRTQAENPYKDTPEAFGMPANPVPPTQQPGPGGMDQGTRVSFFRGAENITPLQLEKTTGEGMPAFPTIGAQTDKFLKRPGITSLFGS